MRAMKKLPTIWSSSAQAIFYLTAILCIIGTVNIFSASFVVAGKEWQDSYFYLKRQGFSLLVGWVLLLMAARFDYRQYRWTTLVFVMFTLVTIVMVPLVGIEANGAKRWLKIGISFQPSEFAKLAVVMLCSTYLGRYVDKSRRVNLFTWPAGVSLIMAVLVYYQPDMGTAVLIIVLAMIIYVLAGLSLTLVGALAIIGAFVATVGVIAAPYRMTRIYAWLDPWKHQQDGGYQAVQAQLAIGSGGLHGSGLGMGASKFFWLPEAHTDFAFAVFSQEWGFLGVCIILMLFTVLARYGVLVALRAQDGYGMLLAGGITALLAGQAVGNMAMVCGLLPVTGVPLPYISFGGTALVVNLAATGILISIGKYGGVIKRPIQREPLPNVQYRDNKEPLIRPRRIK